MIIPFFVAAMEYARLPITWILIIMNLILYINIHPFQDKVEQEIQSILLKDDFFLTHSKVYYYYLKNQEKIDSEHFNKDSLVYALALNSKVGEVDDLYRLAVFSFRDKQFLNYVKDHKIHFGDQQLVTSWEKQMDQLQELQQKSPHAQWGLSDQGTWVNWLTYLFVHASFWHLLGNMAFLLIFGSVLELLMGPLFFLLFYILAGIFGAFVFMSVFNFSSIPLVGASGAISGLMAFFVTLYWTRPVRFFYWLFPIPGYFGWLFLPAWTVALLWLFSDLAGFFGTISEVGGIAYAAHLGGAFMGICVGLLFRPYVKLHSPYFLRQLIELNEPLGPVDAEKETA